MLIALFLFSNISFAHADWFAISSIAGSAMNDLASQYGVNTQELKNNISTMNNLRQKMMPPQVTLSLRQRAQYLGKK